MSMYSRKISPFDGSSEGDMIGMDHRTVEIVRLPNVYDNPVISGTYVSTEMMEDRGKGSQMEFIGEVARDLRNRNRLKIKSVDSPCGECIRCVDTVDQEYMVTRDQISVRVKTHCTEKSEPTCDAIHKKLSGSMAPTKDDWDDYVAPWDKDDRDIGKRSFDRYSLIKSPAKYMFEGKEVPFNPNNLDDKTDAISYAIKNANPVPSAPIVSKDIPLTATDAW